MCKKSPAAPAETAYVYVLSRLDLPHSVRSVQIAHAAIAAERAYGEPKKTHPHLVVCAVANEQELADVFNRLKEQGVPCCAWYEDDLDNQLTAVATGPLRGAERNPVRYFKLLR